MRSIATWSATDRRSENVGIGAVIVPELKFRDVERQILAADLVIAAHDTALNQRPKTFDCVGVDCADNVLACLVIDLFLRRGGMQYIELNEGRIAAKQAIRSTQTIWLPTLLQRASCLYYCADFQPDMIAFIDPRQSRVDITQAVGRAMLKCPTKKAKLRRAFRVA